MKGRMPYPATLEVLALGLLVVGIIDTKAVNVCWWLVEQIWG